MSYNIVAFVLTVIVLQVKVGLHKPSHGLRISRMQAQQRNLIGP